MSLELYDCITANECQKAIRSVYLLKDMWIPRAGAGFPFYTLGTASYLDAADKGKLYYKIQAKKTNPILKEHFFFLYEKVRETLKRATGKEVEFEEEFALPGFHIFQYSEFFNFPIASYHFDLQFKEMFWGKYHNIDYNHPLSFTLSLKLPSGGGGLNYWDIFYDQVEKMSNDQLDEFRKQSEMYFVEYEVGKMVVHEGLMLHQIAPMKEMKLEDERITLQGHGLFCDNVLKVYW